MEIETPELMSGCENTWKCGGVWEENKTVWGQLGFWKMKSISEGAIGISHIGCS